MSCPSSPPRPTASGTRASGQAQSQLGNALPEVGDVGHEIGAHVGRGDYHRRALRHGRPRQLDAFGEVGRPVVQPGQEVEVQVSPSAHTFSFGQIAGHLVAIL